MNDQELRQIVRQAIAKTSAVQGLAGVQSSGSGVQGQSRVQGPVQSQVRFVPESVPFGSHASHAIYMQLVNDNGGACLIEPTVACNHCGYCQSHGH